MKVQINKSALKKNLMDEEKLWDWFKNLLKSYDNKLSASGYSVKTIQDVTAALFSRIKHLSELLWGYGDGVPRSLGMVKNFMCKPRCSDTTKETVEKYVLRVAEDLCRCVAELYCNHKWLAGSESWKSDEWRKVMTGQHRKVLTSSNPMIPNALDISYWLVQASNKAKSQPLDEKNVDDIIATIEKLKNAVIDGIAELSSGYRDACYAANRLQD